MRNKPTKVIRTITASEYYVPSGSRRGSGAYRLTLSCGHDKYVPASQLPKRQRVTCATCAELRVRKLGSIWPDKGVQEVWDSQTELPKLIPWTESQPPG